jgi:hypothetical protein
MMGACRYHGFDYDGISQTGADRFMKRGSEPPREGPVQ